MQSVQFQEHIRKKLESFTDTCRSAGMKVTHQRTEIYRLLLQFPDHPSAETIHKRLIQTLPTVSLDTVYRTLATLEQHGLVARIQTPESQARFEAVMQPHHHLICSQCKQIVDFEWPAIDQMVLPKPVSSWGKVESKNIIVYGQCETCLKSMHQI